jgi:hypothetical protein
VARSFHVVSSLELARSFHLVFSMEPARSISAGFSSPMARSGLLVFLKLHGSLRSYGILQALARSSPQAFSMTMARLPSVVFSSRMARSLIQVFTFQLAFNYLYNHPPHTFPSIRTMGFEFSP